jgi:hypothetical protein
MKKQLDLFPQEELQQDFNEVNEQPAGSIGIEQPEKIADAEWCFQFFNNEPVVFAYSQEGEEPAPLVLQVEPVNGQGLTFKQNGMEFKIYAQPISDETKKDRAEAINQKQNVSTNKEA